VVVRREQDL
jgi:chromosome segregation ATPase